MVCYEAVVDIYRGGLGTHTCGSAKKVLSVSWFILWIEFPRRAVRRRGTVPRLVHKEFIALNKVSWKYQFFLILSYYLCMADLRMRVMSLAVTS